jgi:hypothetical protein
MRRVTELAARTRRSDLSSVDALDATIERIEARNPTINALVYLGIENAREAERQLITGAELAQLHGVPTAIKDLFDFKPGWPATFGGVPAVRDYPVDDYCAFSECAEGADGSSPTRECSGRLGFQRAPPPAKRPRQARGSSSTSAASSTATSLCTAWRAPPAWSCERRPDPAAASGSSRNAATAPSPPTWTSCSAACASTRSWSVASSPTCACIAPASTATSATTTFTSRPTRRPGRAPPAAEAALRAVEYLQHGVTVATPDLLRGVGDRLAGASVSPAARRPPGHR